MSLTKDIKFTPWDLDSRIIEAIQQLKDTTIKDHESVNIAIQLLETLGYILEAEIKETDILLNEKDMNSLFDIYWKSLTSLKDNEGVNFCLAYKSFKICIRIIPFYFGLIYDGWSHLGVKIPEAVRELM